MDLKDPIPHPIPHPIPQRATILKRMESSGASAILTLMLSGVGAVLPFAIQMETGTSERMIWLLVLIAPAAISLVAARRRATMGMIINDLWHGSPTGGEISFGLCLARVLTGMVLAPIYPVSLIVALLNERKQTIPDLVCGTSVWADRKAVRRDAGFEVVTEQRADHYEEDFRV